jgi:endonuclease/exonuclease/phosphatase family metal-dependent hydrolase
MNSMISKISNLLIALTVFCGADSLFAELPSELRVVTYNIHHGEGTDGKIDLERIARLLVAEKPHLVAVNEVDQGTNRTHQIDMPADLSRLTGMKAVFEKNIDFEGGKYGNAVLSSLPIRRHENHQLPSNYEGEQRGVLEIEIGDEGGDDTLLFLATHLDYRPDDAERMASVKKIEEVLASRMDVPVVLAGDLNATPDSRVIAAFTKTWKLTNTEPLPTFPAANPKNQIDYVLVRPADRWEVVEVRVLDEAVASDHRGLIAVLRMLPASAKGE